METTTQNFTYSFISSKTPEAIYNLLLHIDQWWFGVYDETIKGASKQLGDEFSFEAGGGAHYTKQKLVELIPNKRIVWLVTGSKLTFISEPEEWTGTKISFDIAADGAKTKVTFTHEGLVTEIECYGACSSGWTSYLKRLEEKLK